MLGDVEWINVKRSVSSPEDLIPAIGLTSPDVLILDVNMMGKNTLDIVPDIKNQFPELKIINFTSYDLPAIRKEAKSVGVDAFLLKNCSKDKLASTIFNILTGEHKEKILPLISASELDRLQDTFEITQSLSERELEILKLVALGNTSQKIANQLNLSKHTIQWHRKNIIQKLNLKSAAEMIRFAHQHNIV